MVQIIGEIARAERDKEQCRILARLAKSPEDKAEYKREFRKARNKVIALKRK